MVLGRSSGLDYLEHKDVSGQSWLTGIFISCFRDGQEKQNTHTAGRKEFQSPKQHELASKSCAFKTSSIRHENCIKNNYN